MEYPLTGNLDLAPTRVSVTDGKAPRHHLLRQEERILETERFEEQPPNCCLVGLITRDLEQPPGQREAGVVVMEERAGAGLQRSPRHGANDLRQRIVAPPAARVHEKVVAVPASRVREQVSRRDEPGPLLVREREVRQVGLKWRVEIEPALFHTAHQSRRCEGLGGRADLEERPVRDIERVVDVRDAERGDELVLTVQHTHSDAGNGQRGHALPGQVLQLAPNSL